MTPHPLPPEVFDALPPAVQAYIRYLEARLADLEARLGRDSSNSSKPPSSDPPHAKPAPPRAPSGRRRGGQLYRRADGKFPKTPAVQLPAEKDWTFLAVGDFNGDGQPDAAFLGYGMEGATAARVFNGRKKTELSFGEKADTVLPLGTLLNSAKKNQNFPLVRDTPVVADWNGDGIDDLVVAHGQSDEVLVFLGDKSGLSKDRVRRVSLEYRVHYEHGVFVGDFNGDGKADLAVFGYTNTGVGAGGPPAAYLWLQ